MNTVHEIQSLECIFRASLVFGFVPRNVKFADPKPYNIHQFCELCNFCVL